MSDVIVPSRASLPSGPQSSSVLAKHVTSIAQWRGELRKRRQPGAVPTQCTPAGATAPMVGDGERDRSARPGPARDMPATSPGRATTTTTLAPPSTTAASTAAAATRSEDSIQVLDPNAHRTRSTGPESRQLWFETQKATASAVPKQQRLQPATHYPEHATSSRGGRQGDTAASAMQQPATTTTTTATGLSALPPPPPLTPRLPSSRITTSVQGGPGPETRTTRDRSTKRSFWRGSGNATSRKTPTAATAEPHTQHAGQNQGLTEVVGPEPVDRRTRRRRSSLEADLGRAPGDSSDTTRQDQGLTEVVGPEPIDRRAHRTNSLEARLSGTGDDSSDSAEPPPTFHTRRRHEDPSAQRPASDAPPSKFATKLYTISHLIFFSFWGTLARLGVQWLTFYPGAPVVTGVLWANFAGSLVMGFLSEDRRLFRNEWGTAPTNDEKSDPKAEKQRHGKVKKTIPLYVGLATGFCGSFTSFSSFQRDVFLALSNDLPTPIDHPYTGTEPSFTSTHPRHNGYSVQALLAVQILTVSLSLSALYLGAHLAIACDPFTPTFPTRLVRRLLDPLIVFLAPACWLGAIFLSIFPPDRPSGPSSRGSWSNEVWRGEVLFALVFAPVGCLLRWYASAKLNPLLATFPLGTFAVNVFGTAVEAMCYDLQHVPLLASRAAGGGRVACQVLQGVMDGFCGCLTTVSTWVAELAGFGTRRHAYVYGAATLVTGLALVVVIMGSVRWSVGWSETACVTMRTID